MCWALIRTGLAVQIPQGYEMQIRARSGLALKTPYLIKNGIGSVDEDYRGEVGVIIHNLSDVLPLVFNKGDRIAQGVIAPVMRCRIYEVSELDETERGSGGFGSTGIN
jgi:dUTP pyrophosphatase